MAKKSWKQTNNWFVNPYNFVPLSCVDRKSIEIWRGENICRKTGSIHCTLKLMTPLAMPDHFPCNPALITKETVTGGIHYSYPFMSIDGKIPFIPGSELRGMIRSVYEAATKSCLGVLDNSVLSGRSYDIKKPGILHRSSKDGNWTLYEGRSVPIKTFGDNKYGFFVSNEEENGLSYSENVRVLHTRDGVSINNLSWVQYNTEVVVTKQRNGREVSTEYVSCIQPYDRKNDAQKLEYIGYLLIGEIGLADSGHHCSHVISLKKDSKGKKIPIKKVDAEELENLRSVLAFYADEKQNKAKDEINHTGYIDYSLEKETLPVYYELVNGKLHLAPAIYSREKYYKTMDEIVGDSIPCSRRTKDSNDISGSICPACALFGTIREDENNGRNYGSAVRFSDAFPAIGCKPDETYTTLKELAEPKPSAAEFYLETPTVRCAIPRTWNFEYIRTRKASTKRGIDFTPHIAKIRGRKFYYHWSKMAPKDYSTDEKTVRNTTVQLLQNGELLQKGDFCFDVYFDGISEQELNELIWCLCPTNPAEPEAKYYHKLGMGKALGLGSVSITVDSVSIRRYDANTGDYIVDSYAIPDDFAAKMAKNSRKLLYMLRFDPAREWSQGYPADMKHSTKGGISYPVAKDYTSVVKPGKPDNSEASYQWFVGNRQISNVSDPGTGIDPKFCQTLPEADNPADPGSRLRVLEKTYD